ncbi:cilia- and flagella-associated protein 251-like [Vespa velutina]|uniref:cilia- and flagella-associated protein 251-like n=1 Tax=Vespa velutina TaxID=202808 RepID=UPI001FB4BBFF|nr:cilia- and flagella-associated protein 251-like [Vespa velutina]
MASSFINSDKKTSINLSKNNTKKEISEFNMCPYKLHYSFGFNPNVPIINLTTKNRTLIAFASSHIAMIYDYSSNEMLPLQGHKTAVRTLSSSNDGKWLLTADFEKDCAVIIWDTEIKMPICTLFEPHGINGLTAARISPNAKYIVTVGNEKLQKVYFWLWTYGRDKPDDTFAFLAIAELSEIHLDRVKEISFDNDFPKRFALTTDHHDQDELSYYRPKITGKYGHFGILNSSVFITKTSNTLTATTTGFVLVWSHVYTVEHTVEDTNFKKKHIKSIKLQTCNITVILNYEGMIVTGNSNGRINFYDNELKLLYWCQNRELECIRSISFDLCSKLLGPVYIISETDIELSDGNSTDELKSEIEYEFMENFVSQEENDTYQDVKYLNDKMDKKLSYLTVNIESIPKYYYDQKNSIYVATDATLQRSRFIVRNSFVYIANLKCKFISKHYAAHITSLDAHPESTYLITGNRESILSLYDYEKCSLIISRKVPDLPNFETIFNDQTKKNQIIYISCPQTHESLTAITALKYSPTSDLLICGMENGTLWVLHPLTLELLDEFPYKHSSQSIRIVAFTKCSTYMAYSVKQVLFGPSIGDDSVPRLFSLGEDKDLIEYDLKFSGPYPDPGLKILQIDRIESKATPLYMEWYPRIGVETFFVISNSEYKYKLLNDIIRMIRGTYVNATFGTPVQRFKVSDIMGFSLIISL